MHWTAGSGPQRSNAGRSEAFGAAQVPPTSLPAPWRCNPLLSTASVKGLPSCRLQLLFRFILPGRVGRVASRASREALFEYPRRSYAVIVTCCATGVVVKVRFLTADWVGFESLLCAFEFFCFNDFDHFEFFFPLFRSRVQMEEQEDESSPEGQSVYIWKFFTVS